jgi:uncharacterized membrane protein
MAGDAVHVLVLVAGTALLRPYVIAFVAAFLCLAGRDLGWGRTVVWLCWGGLAAFAAEYSSTRTGIPFGHYNYSGATSGQELFISNVPLFDMLSFPFLAYGAWCLARAALGRTHGWAPVALSGLLMMASDVVIDPLAVRGDRWFLGEIFSYHEAGVYFGVPFSNFGGWILLGWVIVGGWLWAVGAPPRPGSPWGGVGLYYGVVLFNLGMTAWIGEGKLFGAGILVHVAVLLLLYRLKASSAARGWGYGSPGEERVTIPTTKNARERSLIP